jgi:hypothetical protein
MKIVGAILKLVQTGCCFGQKASFLYLEHWCFNIDKITKLQHIEEYGKTCGSRSGWLKVTCNYVPTIWRVRGRSWRFLKVNLETSTSIKLPVSHNKKGNCFKVFFLKEELFEVQRVRVYRFLKECPKSHIAKLLLKSHGNTTLLTNTSRFWQWGATEIVQVAYFTPPKQ